MDWKRGVEISHQPEARERCTSMASLGMTASKYLAAAKCAMRAVDDAPYSWNSPRPTPAES